MYVAVKGGEAAILNSYRLLAEQRRGDAALPELSVAQIRQQLKLAVDRVMTEGSVYDPELAALAIKQAAGDLVEAIFLLRAYRATLPRLGTTCPLDTSRMALDRRISATFKDLPGGQVLGPTYDYTQRLLDFTLLAEGRQPEVRISAGAPAPQPGSTPRVVDLLNQEGLIETRPVPPGDPAPTDLTREPLRFPADRATRLQNLARGDEGFLLAMAYSTQRGYSHSHPFVGEVRGRGLLIGMELVQDRRSREPLAKAHCEWLFQQCLQRGLLTMAYSPRLRISPPLVITEEQALEGAAILDDALTAFAAERYSFTAAPVEGKRAC